MTHFKQGESKADLTPFPNDQAEMRKTRQRFRVAFSSDRLCLKFL